MDVVDFPCDSVETVSSTMWLTLRSLGEMMPPPVAMDLLLDVVSLGVVGCFSGPCSLTRLFLVGFGRERSKCWDLDLNKITNL